MPVVHAGRGLAVTLCCLGFLRPHGRPRFRRANLWAVWDLGDESWCDEARLAPSIRQLCGDGRPAGGKGAGQRGRAAVGGGGLPSEYCTPWRVVASDPIDLGLHSTSTEGECSSEAHSGLDFLNPLHAGEGRSPRPWACEWVEPQKTQVEARCRRGARSALRVPMPSQGVYSGKTRASDGKIWRSA